jgi:hypothetical protein
MVLRRFGQPKKQESKGSLKGPLSRPRWRRGTMKAPRRPVDYGEEGRELGQHFVSKLLFLFVLSTFEFIIAGDDEYIGNKGHIISDLAFEVYDGKVYPDCTFFCFLYLFLFFYFYFVLITLPHGGTLMLMLGILTTCCTPTISTQGWWMFSTWITNLCLCIYFCSFMCHLEVR